MAGSRTSSPDDAAAGGRADLLATKLNLPQPRPDHLGRSRLIERLNQGMAREVILVCTPAGFGKTTLLAEWVAGARWPVAWLSLDPEDGEPARFWRYVVAALDRVRGGLAEHLLPLLTPPAAVSGKGVVTALVNRLQDAPEEVALVLDDYHLLGSRPIHDGVAFLLDHLPPQLHVVITSRSDPPLPLARLRARGQLVELRTADLRFTPEESAALLREVWQLQLAPAAIAVLGSRTEGWAVGLQLATLSLRECPDPDAFLRAFAGTHRYVLDYLSQEVLERLPDRVRTTTVRILTTLIRADAGQARVAGFDVARERRRVRRAISLTGQFAAVDDLQTGEENLRMMGRLSGLSSTQARRRAHQLLDQFDLAEAGRRRVATYSGGMRRRLDLAASLVAHPEVLFLDEPATGLDLRGRQAMWQVVSGLAGSGVTVFLTTQYLEEADRLADRIAVLDGGRVVADGTAAQLKRQVAGQRLDLVLADAAAFDQIARFLAERAVLSDPSRLTIGVATDGSAAQVRALLDEVDPGRGAVRSFAVHSATLDDVFLALTGRGAGRPEKETVSV